MRILVVNPNTTASMTATIVAAARAAAASGTEIAGVTSTMGPASIEGFYDEALAVPGLLTEIARLGPGEADAVVIACFDDTGLDAARAMADIPVFGLCESAVAAASFVAQRYSIVTTLERSRVPIEGLVARYGATAKCRVRAADIPVLALEDHESGAVDRLRREIARALDEDRAEAIILGCAGMTRLAAELSAEFGVPVIDGVAMAVKMAEALVHLGLTTSKRGAYASPPVKNYTGAMQAFAPVARTE